MTFDAAAFRAFLQHDRRLENWDARNRIARRVQLLVDEGLDYAAFSASVSHAVEQGEAALAIIAKRAQPKTLTHYRVAVNHLAEWIHGARPFDTHPRRKLPRGDMGDILSQLRRQIVATRGFTEDTARNHVDSIRRLTRLHGFDPLRFTQDDFEAQEQADNALLSVSQTKPTPGWYNDHIDAIQHLADAYHLAIDVERRPETDKFDPDALEVDELVRLVGWYCPDPHRCRVGRAAVPWFLFATKRPGESVRVDLIDIDVSRPEAPRVRIRYPGKRGTKHWVMMPTHALSPKRPLGSYYRWRLDLQQLVEAGKVRMAPGDKYAFWLVRIGHNKYRRPAPSYLTGLIREASRSVGVRATPTRLRKTGLTLIANGTHTDFLDAQDQANHSRADTTRRYVKRTPEERRKRLRHAQKDIHQGKGQP